MSNLSVEERFESKVDRGGGAEACHVWRGSIDRTGYGRMWNEVGRPEGAHRLAWRIANRLESLATNDDIVQTCGERLCVNVAHLVHRPQPTVEERFWRYVDKNGPTPAHRPELGPCWVWTGGFDGRGYPAFGIARNTSVRATRYAFVIADDAWPPDHLLACHHCDNPKCVRREHLFLGTDLDNAHDAIAKGRRPGVARTIRPESAVATKEG